MRSLKITTKLKSSFVFSHDAFSRFKLLFFSFVGFTLFTKGYHYTHMLSISSVSIYVIYVIKDEQEDDFGWYYILKAQIVRRTDSLIDDGQTDENDPEKISCHFHHFISSRELFSSHALKLRVEWMMLYHFLWTYWDIQEVKKRRAMK